MNINLSIETSKVISIIEEHLDLCNYTISGYWDQDEKFYEEIILPRTLYIKLVNKDIFLRNNDYYLKLEVNLCYQDNDNKPLAKLTLILNKELEFVDENWDLNLSKELCAVKCTV